MWKWKSKLVSGKEAEFGSVLGVSSMNLAQIAKINQRKYELCQWLTIYAKDVFESEDAKNCDYVAITDCPPTQLHLFSKKNDLMAFLSENKLAAYRYRRYEDMVYML